MIKFIIRKFAACVNNIIYIVRRKRNMKKMMAYYLKIKPAKLATYNTKGAL